MLRDLNNKHILVRICHTLKPVMSTPLLFGRETQLMRYSSLQKALHGPIQIQPVMKMKELSPHMLSVLWKISSLEENLVNILWNGFGNLPRPPETTYPNSRFLQKTSKPTQKWKPLL